MTGKIDKHNGRTWQKAMIFFFPSIIFTPLIVKLLGGSVFTITPKWACWQEVSGRVWDWGCSTQYFNQHYVCLNLVPLGNVLFFFRHVLSICPIFKLLFFWGFFCFFCPWSLWMFKLCSADHNPSIVCTFLLMFRSLNLQLYGWVLYFFATHLHGLKNWTFQFVSVTFFPFFFHNPGLSESYQSIYIYTQGC